MADSQQQRGRSLQTAVAVAPGNAGADATAHTVHVAVSSDSDSDSDDHERDVENQRGAGTEDALGRYLSNATTGRARLADILSVGSGRALVQARPAMWNEASSRLLDALEAAGAVEMAEVLRNLRNSHPDLDLLSEYAPPDPVLVARYRAERQPRALPDPHAPTPKPAHAGDAPHAGPLPPLPPLLPLCGTSTGAFPAPCVQPRAGLVRFGAGVSAYFRFLKLLLCMFVALFLITLPSTMTSLSVGSYFQGGFAVLATTTLGNMYVPRNGTGAGGAVQYAVQTDFLCVAPAPPGSGAACLTDSDRLSVFYAVVDALAGLAFLGFAALARAGTRREEARFRRLVRRVEHYSVAVRPLPPGCSREDVRAHFEALLGGTGAGASVGENGAGAGVGGCVHDVQLVSSTGDELALAVRRGTNIQRLARADAQRRRARPGSVSARAAERRFDALLRRVAALDLDAAADGGSLSMAGGAQSPRSLRGGRGAWGRVGSDVSAGAGAGAAGRALYAFVSFERQADRERCLRLYDQPTCGMRQVRDLRLNGEAEIKVSEAPPPSALLWENSDASACVRTARLLLTALALLLLLAAHVALNRLAQPLKLSRNFDEAVSGAAGAAPCGGVVAGAADFAAAAAAAAAAGALPGGVSAFDCLCEALYAGTIDVPDPLAQEQAQCADYRTRRLEALGVQVAVAAAVLGINLLAYWLMSRAARSMRHRSVIARDRTVLRGVFVLMLLNAGLLLLLLHADLAPVVQSSALRELLGDGRYNDLSAGWFRVAGFEVLLLGLLNVFAPHALAACQLLRAAWRRCGPGSGSGSGGVGGLSLAEARERAVGPEFALSFRLAQALFTVYFVLTYSAGIPALYLLGALWAAVAYWVDKFMFLRVCRAPETQSAALQDWVNAVLPFAIVPHTLMAVWMLSGPGIFPSAEAPNVDALALSPGWFNQDSGSVFKEAATRFARRSSIPLLLLVFGFLGLRLLGAFGARADRAQRAVAHVLWRGARRCCGGRCARGMGGAGDAGGLSGATRAWAEPPSLAEAKRSGALSGLPSYFVLENPSYKRYFPDLNQDRAVNDELRSHVPGIAP